MYLQTKIQIRDYRCFFSSPVTDPEPKPSPFPPAIAPALRAATLTEEVEPTMGIGRFEKTSFFRTTARMVYETRRNSESVSVVSADASIAESEVRGVARCRTASGFGRLTNFPSSWLCPIRRVGLPCRCPNDAPVSISTSGYHQGREGLPFRLHQFSIVRHFDRARRHGLRVHPEVL